MRKKIMLLFCSCFIAAECMCGCKENPETITETISLQSYERESETVEADIDYLQEARNRVWGQKSKIPELENMFDATFMQQYYAEYWSADAGSLMKNKSLLVYGSRYYSETVNSFDVEAGSYVRIGILILPYEEGTADLVLEKDGVSVWEKTGLEKGEEFYLYSDNTKAGTYTLKCYWSESESGTDTNYPYVNITAFQVSEKNAEQYTGGDEID